MGYKTVVILPKCIGNAMGVFDISSVLGPPYFIPSTHTHTRAKNYNSFSPSGKNNASDVTTSDRTIVTQPRS